MTKPTHTEQPLLFSEDSFLPQHLPPRFDLRPASNLAAIFNDCHNYVYANEGLLKDKIFHEIVKLLMMKLYDEQGSPQTPLSFGVTASEYRLLVANQSSSFETRIKTLFSAVQTQYRDLLSGARLLFKPLTLAYIVAQLQHISLSQTPGDVKGEAFQSFVNRHQRGDRGEFFTPHPVVRLAVAMIDPQPSDRVIDPACGSGGFLIQAIAHSQANHPTSDRNAYIQHAIRGIEFNPDVALSAMIRLAFEGGTGHEIRHANALLGQDDLMGTFDVVLTNPPFGNKGKVEDQAILKSYSLARKWSKCANQTWEPTATVLAKQSPDILFIEQSLKLLRPGGRMAIVLPDGLLQNISTTHLRYWVRSQAAICAVISIPQEAFVPYGTGIKTSLLLLQKLPAPAKPVFMAQIQKIGYDVKGQTLYRRDPDGNVSITPDGTPIVDEDLSAIASAYHNFNHQAESSITHPAIYSIPQAQLNSRWDVEHYQPADQDLLAHLQAGQAKPLGEIALLLREGDNFRAKTTEPIRYIAISDIDARAMQVIAQHTIASHEAPSRATYRVKSGDILTAISGASTGTKRHATALISEDEDGAICSNGLAVIRNIQGVEPLFLLAYMRTDYYLRQVRRLMTGHAIPAISMDDLAQVLVPLPPLSIQKQIAERMATVVSTYRASLKTGEQLVNETEALLGQPWG